jgi:hypothetical protein
MPLPVALAPIIGVTDHPLRRNMASFLHPPIYAAGYH